MSMASALWENALTCEIFFQLVLWNTDLQFAHVAVNNLSEGRQRGVNEKVRDVVTCTGSGGLREDGELERRQLAKIPDSSASSHPSKTKLQIVHPHRIPLMASRGSRLPVPQSPCTLTEAV